MSFLRDLEIKRISFVRKNKARPVNPKATTLFVKSDEKIEKKKGGKSMDFFEFLKKCTTRYKEAGGEDGEEIKKETPKKEITEPETPEYITKADFKTAIDILAGQISDLSVIVKANVESKNDAIKVMSEFTTEFMKAYEEDQVKLQKAVVDTKKEKIQKEMSDLPEQKDWEELVKSAGNVDGLFNTNVGKSVDKVIEKGLKDGTMQKVASPISKNSYEDAFMNAFGR